MNSYTMDNTANHTKRITSHHHVKLTQVTQKFEGLSFRFSTNIVILIIINKVMILYTADMTSA